jgi:hypothetical protein
MNDREILTAALRWSTALEDRKEIGKKKRLYEKYLKAYGDSQFNVDSPTYQRTSWLRRAASDAAPRLRVARRKEPAAIRDLAKVCVKARVNQQQVCDADVIDLPMKLIRLN